VVQGRVASAIEMATTQAGKGTKDSVGREPVKTAAFLNGETTDDVSEVLVGFAALGLFVNDRSHRGASIAGLRS
jgi:hypothetical protein